MQRLRIGFIAGAALVVASAGAGAQLRGSASIPAGFMPPAGMCRVWYNGVAPGRQPAPTTCQNARASLRANTRLVYGPALRTNDPRNGSYDPRNGTYDPRNGTYDPRNDQGGWNNGNNRNNRDDDDRYSDKQRRRAEKERQQEWKRAHRNGNDDGDDEDDRGNRRDRGSYDRNGSRTQGTIYDGRTGRSTNQPGTWGRASGTAGAQCIDANRDGVCDNQQGVGRVRIP